VVEASASPDAGYFCACCHKVGGVLANDSYPAEFLHDILAIRDERHR